MPHSSPCKPFLSHNSHGAGSSVSLCQCDKGAVRRVKLLLWGAYTCSVTVLTFFFHCLMESLCKWHYCAIRICQLGGIIASPAYIELWSENWTCFVTHWQMFSSGGWEGDGGRYLKEAASWFSELTHTTTLPSSLILWILVHAFACLIQALLMKSTSFPHKCLCHPMKNTALC